MTFLCYANTTTSQRKIYLLKKRTMYYLLNHIFRHFFSYYWVIFDINKLVILMIKWIIFLIRSRQPCKINCTPNNQAGMDYKQAEVVQLAQPINPRSSSITPKRLTSGKYHNSKSNQKLILSWLCRFCALIVCKQVFADRCRMTLH